MILLEILIYALNDSSKFGGCHPYLSDPRQFLGVFLCGRTTGTQHSLENIPNYEKNNIIFMIPGDPKMDSLKCYNIKS